MSKKNIYITILILLNTLAWGMLLKDHFIVYSATDVFQGAKFDFETGALNIESIDLNTEDIYHSISISPEQQQQLIRTLKDSKFKPTDFSFHHDYHITMNLNKNYEFYVNTDDKTIEVQYENKAYIFKNDDFIKILKSLVK